MPARAARPGQPAAERDGAGGDGPILEPPRKDALALDPAAGHVGEVVAGDIVEDARVEVVEVDELDWSGVRMLGAVLAVRGVGQLRLADAALVSTRIESPDVVRLAASGGSWRGAEVRGGRIGDLDAADARWERVLLEGVRIGYLSLRGAEVADLLLKGCQIETLDLAGAGLQRVRLDDCEVGELLLARARLRDVDLRGASVGRLEGVDGLRGAAITPMQLVDLAPQLADGLGLRVLAEDE